jgi:GH25 family lysozyme M1 (1,4-beta-N-acetylmuramidase)
LNSVTKRVKAILTVALAAVAIAVASPAGAQTVTVQAANLPTPLRGIDVSSYQGNIDWNAVKASGIDYAMVRIGNTQYGLDNKFAQNVMGATAAGIRVGCYVYTYAKNANEAAQDAHLALAAMQQFPVTFPVALDLEDPSQEKLSPQTLADITNTFCSIIYEGGYTPMIYSYKNWMVQKMPPATWDHWVAHYADATDYPYPHAMWQYSAKGKVAGIAGSVDMNFLYKDYFTKIVQEGFVKDGDLTYYYHNWKRVNGMRYVNGVRYYFDENGAMLKDRTMTDGDGNTVRVCKDGHVVMITVEMRQYAKAQEQALVAAQAAYQQAVAYAPQAAKAAQDAAALIPALQQQAQNDTNVMNTAFAAASADPTNVDLITTLATAQQAAANSNNQLAAAQAKAAQLQQAAVNAQNDVPAKAAAIAAQQQALAAAQAAIVIPD